MEEKDRELWAQTLWGPLEESKRKGEVILKTHRREQPIRQSVINKDVIKLDKGLSIRDLDNLKYNILKNKINQLEQKEESRRLRVAAYCRVSTHLDEQKVSLQTQLAFYSYKILSNPDWELAGIYVDDGVSASSREYRDDFNRMIEDAKQGKIDMIITKSISRFSRNIVDVLETIKTLHELTPPCKIYFHSERLMSDDLNTSLILKVRATIAQEEITGLSNSISWGLQKLAQRGIVSRRTDLYGYKIDKKGEWHVVIEEAKVVEQMYEMCANGKTVFDIIQWLKDEHIKSPTGRENWSDTTVRGILRNEKYMGDYEYQKTYTPDVIGSKNRDNKGQVPKYYIEQHHPPIVTQQLYDQVQQVFDERSKAPVQDKRKDGTAGREAYYKKFTCTECGRLVSRYRSTARNTKEGSSWRCINSYELVHSTCEVELAVLEKYIDYHFVETLKQIRESQAFKNGIEAYLARIELKEEDWVYKEQLKEQMEAMNQQLYKAVDMQVQKKGKDTNLINQITDDIIQLRAQQDAYIKRIEKRAYEGERLKRLIEYCEKMSDTSFRAFHHMRPRIKHGESLYNTTNNAKYSTYMEEDGEDQFPEEVFREQVISATLDKEGRIKYKFAEGLEFSIPLTYEAYKQRFEKELQEIQFEELVNSKEALMIRACCKTSKQYKEIKECVGIASDNSFRKRILTPLHEKGKLQIEEGSSKSRKKYYWSE